MKQLSTIWMRSALAVAAVSLPLAAQNNFNSGSTGADGAFAPTASQNIVVPASGVFNYTTVSIPGGVTITYIANAANTPVTLLATGDVQIFGTLRVNGSDGSTSGFGGLGGPGAARGGGAGVNGVSGTIGDGPGGGKGGPVTPGPPVSCANGGAGGGGFQAPGGGSLGGSPYGTKTLIPLIGGSGGGGGCGASLDVGTGGGGGGGAILVASSTQILFNGGTSNGFVTARGGNGAGKAGANGSGGGGSGGAIRLVANTISGTGSLDVTGGSGGGASSGPQTGTNGGFGYIRIEAFNLTGFSPNSNNPISSGLPTSAIPPNLPTLQIVSVAGVAAPANPVGSFQGSPDVILPANQANPVAVVVNATNIPSGTTVNVTATASSGTATTASTTLAGTTASSSGTANVTLATGLSVLTATTLIDLAQTSDLRPLFINGEKVEKIEVAARYGEGSELTYITQSGRRVRSPQ